jgi:hypothetical protein
MLAVVSEEAQFVLTQLVKLLVVSVEVFAILVNEVSETLEGSVKKGFLEVFDDISKVLVFEIPALASILPSSLKKFGYSIFTTVPFGPTKSMYRSRSLAKEGVVIPLRAAPYSSSVGDLC